MNTNKLEPLKLKIAIGAMEHDEIETPIYVPKEMYYYYLPDDYIEPSKVRLIDIYPMISIENKIQVLARVANEEDKWEDMIQPELLFDSKDKAGDYYLKTHVYEKRKLWKN